MQFRDYRNTIVFDNNGNNIIYVTGTAKFDEETIKYGLHSYISNRMKIDDEKLYNKFGRNSRYSQHTLVTNLKFIEKNSYSNWYHKHMDRLEKQIHDGTLLPILDFNSDFIKDLSIALKNFDTNLYLKKTNTGEIYIKKKILLMSMKNICKIRTYVITSKLNYPIIQQLEIKNLVSDYMDEYPITVVKFIGNFIRTYDNNSGSTYLQPFLDRINEIIDTTKQESLANLNLPTNAELPELSVPRNSESVISKDTIQNGNILVNWTDPGSQPESTFGRYYKQENYNMLPSPKKNPVTRQPIGNTKKYRAVIKQKESSTSSSINNRKEPSESIGNDRPVLPGQTNTQNAGYRRVKTKSRKQKRAHKRKQTRHAKK